MRVWYMNGAGNNFAVLDARNIGINMSDTARRLCEASGCDGFMALDNSSIADFKLHFYNSDGSRAEMCGNGARCICRFAYDNGIAGEQMTVETDAGIVFGERIRDNVYRVRLNTPINISVNEKCGIDYCVVGVPHAVIELDNIDFYSRKELFDRARSLREKLNANVNFYSKINENTVKILTYERGVEDFTLACGTGSGALATILFSKGEILDNVVTVKNQGGDLEITVISKADKIIELYLEGNAVVDSAEDI